VTFSEYVQEKQISFACSTTDLTEDSFEQRIQRSTSQDTLLDNEAIAQGIESIDLSFDEPNLDEESDDPTGHVDTEMPANLAEKEKKEEEEHQLLSTDPPSSLFDFPVPAGNVAPTPAHTTDLSLQKSPERKEFSWETLATPKPASDPFVDDETVKASRIKQFVIKSPFGNGSSNCRLFLISATSFSRALLVTGQL
jgi:hypothetical protein